MGFWDSLGGVMKEAGKQMAEGAQNIQRCRNEYASYSDSKLVSIINDNGFFGSSSSERLAAMAVLKDRHGTEGAKELIRRGC